MPICFQKHEPGMCVLEAASHDDAPLVPCSMRYGWRWKHLHTREKTVFLHSLTLYLFPHSLSLSLSLLPPWSPDMIKVDHPYTLALVLLFYLSSSFYSSFDPSFCVEACGSLRMCPSLANRHFSCWREHNAFFTPYYGLIRPHVGG